MESISNANQIAVKKFLERNFDNFFKGSPKTGLAKNAKKLKLTHFVKVHSQKQSRYTKDQAIPRVNSKRSWSSDTKNASGYQ